MRLDGEWTPFPTGGTVAQAYRVAPGPADGALPAVVLVQEMWGVDDHIRDLADRVATAGYLALAPDLYSRGGRRPDALDEARVTAAKRFLDTIPPSSWWDEEARAAALDALPPAEGEALKATFAALFAARDTARSVAMLRDAVRFVRDDPACGARIGSAGWCMGGGLSGRLACAEPDLGAAIIFYGAAPEPDELGGIACPVLGFYGRDDPRITGAVPGFAAAMKAAGKDYEWHIYEGAPHAFFNDTRRSYHPAAARDAWARALSFFAAHLTTPARESGRTQS